MSSAKCQTFCLGFNLLTHWGWVMYICVSTLTTFGSDNGLVPGRHQAIIWTNAEILLIRTLGTNFSEISNEICTFSLRKMHLKISAKWRRFCLSLNVLTVISLKKIAGWPRCWIGQLLQVYIRTPLKTKDHQFDNFVIAALNNNLRCHQWWHICQTVNLLFSVSAISTFPQNIFQKQGVSYFTDFFFV